MSQEEYYLEKCFAFPSGARVSKMLEDKRMLVGVFMTSFRFRLWGVKEEEGRAMGTYIYVVNDVQGEICFPCKPVSLSYHVFLPIVPLSP